MSGSVDNNSYARQIAFHQLKMQKWGAAAIVLTIAAIISAILHEQVDLSSYQKLELGATVLMGAGALLSLGFTYHHWNQKLIANLSKYTLEPKSTKITGPTIALLPPEELHDLSFIRSDYTSETTSSSLCTDVQNLIASYASEC